MKAYSPISLFCVVSLALGVNPAYGQNCRYLLQTEIRHAEIPSLEQAKVITRLRAVQWTDALTPDQVEVVRTSLSSDSDMLVEAAVDVVAVHDLEDLSQELYTDIGTPNSFARILGRLTADALTQVEGSTGFEGRLQRGAADFLADKSEAYSLLMCKVRETLVIRASRSLRRGEAAPLDIPEAELTEHQRLLLEYSSRPQAEAVESIVETLSLAEIAGVSKYSLVYILSTYGEAPIDRVVSILSDEETLRDLGPYARLLFVQYLREATFSHKLTEGQKAALSRALSRPDYFGSPTSLQISVDLFRQEMRGANEEN